MNRFAKSIFASNPFRSSIQFSSLLGNRTGFPSFQKSFVKYESSIPSIQELKEMSPFDAEKELFRLKRAMSSQYTRGDYESALQSASDLGERIKALMGDENAMYASALNNIALMKKMSNDFDSAIDNYTEALQIYSRVLGPKHPSYAATLCNLGIIFKSSAEQKKGMERLQLIDRAEEALSDAYKLRCELSGDRSREAIIASNSLAMVLRMKHTRKSDPTSTVSPSPSRKTVLSSLEFISSSGKEGETGKMIEDSREGEAEELLLSNLTKARDALGDKDPITATTLNNLGYLYKEEKRFEESRQRYQEALDIRKATLGELHPDTVITMNNMAELFDAMGDEKSANDIRAQILNLFGNEEEDESSPRE